MIKPINTRQRNNPIGTFFWQFTILLLVYYTTATWHTAYYHTIIFSKKEHIFISLFQARYQPIMSVKNINRQRLLSSTDYIKS